VVTLTWVVTCACADLHSTTQTFFTQWTTINRDGETVLYDSSTSQPTPLSAFAAQEGHPRLAAFVSKCTTTAIADFDLASFVNGDATPERDTEDLDGCTTLAHIAAQHATRDNDYHYELVKAMVDAGVDVNKLNHYEQTILGMAKASENARLQNWGKTYGKFLARYELAESAIHCSATCLVICAYDFGSVEQPQEPKPVALKFMRNQEEYEREIEMRLLDRYRAAALSHP
jgi:hypothetical protein